MICFETCYFAFLLFFEQKCWGLLPTQLMTFVTSHAIACEVFKSLNKGNPPFMKEMFTQNETMYNLRDGTTLIQPKFNTITYGRNTFTYYGSHIWNLLPNDLKNNVNYDTFKRLLKDWDGPRCCCSLCYFEYV